MAYITHEVIVPSTGRGSQIGKVRASRAGDREFGSGLSQTSDLGIDTCYFLARRLAFIWMSKDWFVPRWVCHGIPGHDAASRHEYALSQLGTPAMNLDVART